ncbi:hypothetical protein HPB48_015109 [Haemaphysalis longicornis]|uniref:Protein Wnt n=1 Tax=Haemaphysalis longicornis TaxID=44386 RepID=A0A9J6G6H7_HAELO|nr:hypothetical protein HPB48_015109 [Haemaphysalis longicornis]
MRIGHLCAFIACPSRKTLCAEPFHGRHVEKHEHLRWASGVNLGLASSFFISGRSSRQKCARADGNKFHVQIAGHLAGISPSLPGEHGISWLALSSSRPPEAWNSSSHSPEAACAEARRLGLLSSRRQERACSAWPWPGSLALASDAARLAVSACLEAFADRRWNCSSLLAAPRLTPDLTVGSYRYSTFFITYCNGRLA